MLHKTNIYNVTQVILKTKYLSISKTVAVSSSKSKNVVKSHLRNCDGHLRRLGHYCGTTGEPVVLRRPRGFTSGRSAGKPGPLIGRPKISRRLIGRLAVTWYLADTWLLCLLCSASVQLSEWAGETRLGQERRLQLKWHQTPVTQCSDSRQTGQIWTRQMQCIFAVRAGSSSGSPH